MQLPVDRQLIVQVLAAVSQPPLHWGGQLSGTQKPAPTSQVRGGLNAAQSAFVVQVNSPDRRSTRQAAAPTMPSATAITMTATLTRFLRAGPPGRSA